MSDYLSKVEHFHQVFNHPILQRGEVIRKNRADLRVELLQEEVKELQQAYGVVVNPDGTFTEVPYNAVEVQDALADIMFVLCGAILESGMKDTFDEAFRRVYESNMSKACKTEQEAIYTVSEYLGVGVEAYYKQHLGLFIVYRSSDNKVLKSKYYKPVELSDLV